MPHVGVNNVLHSKQNCNPFHQSSSSSSSSALNSFDKIENASNPYNSTGSKKRISRWSIVLFCNAISVTFLGYLSYKRSIDLQSTQKAFNLLQKDFELLEQLIHSTELELESAHQDFHALQMNVLAGEGPKAKSQYSEFTEEERALISQGVVDKHDAQADRIGDLQHNIQIIHQTELERRFGPGPYHLEFSLNVQGQKRYFTIETAPNDKMPHSVYYFMDMVDNRLWDDTVFGHRWPHIIQSAPITSGGLNKRHTMEKTLVFPEYSPDYQHYKYSVGFAGRPGGPDFYINLMDNLESHGPGKQLHSKVLNDADPCFARVIIGQEVIDEMKMISDEFADSYIEDDQIIFSSIETVRRISVGQDHF